MKRITTLIAAMLMATSAHAAEPTVDEKCTRITAMAVSAFNARKQGLTEDQSMQMLRDKKIYSGIIVWAVNQAMKAPQDTAEWVLRGAVFSECVKRGAV